jgi:hypothetical protein
MGYITLNSVGNGIVELVFDQPGSSVNTMGMEYDAAMKAAVAELQRMVAAGAWPASTCVRASGVSSSPAATSRRCSSRI